ncbi:MAG: bifunctional diaminohydroxyphosphoribosylaminopyrimidine deaminase/5-amino-6-(5-phosphoribosylamino)uracil reductase RibD [Candidatus Dormiibacterota bacterium]
MTEPNQGELRTDGSGDLMARALQLARLANYRTTPNPMVGAVLIRDGVVVGEGHHTRAGGPHAEVVALDQAGPLARGATLWVTLEPCSTTGRTGPCTERILAAGVAEVRVATLDPNPAVDGRGVSQLRAAGLRVQVGEREEEAKALIREFSHWVSTGVPLVTLKFAMSLDGKVATAGGDSQWITSDLGRARGHQLRSQHDAIMVGSGTVLADDPQLTARNGDEGGRQPVRVIVDSRLRTPANAKVLRTAGGAVLVATAGEPDAVRRRALEHAGAEILLLPADEGKVSLAALLQHLGERQLTSLLVEGGPTLLGSFLAQRLGNRIAAFVAPILLGGVGAPGPFGGPGAATLDQSWRAAALHAEAIGPDLLLTAEV